MSSTSSLSWKVNKGISRTATTTNKKERQVQGEEATTTTTTTTTTSSASMKTMALTKKDTSNTTCNIMDGEADGDEQEDDEDDNDKDNDKDNDNFANNNTNTDINNSNQQPPQLPGTHQEEEKEKRIISESSLPLRKRPPPSPAADPEQQQQEQQHYRRRRRGGGVVVGHNNHDGGGRGDAAAAAVVTGVDGATRGLALPSHAPHDPHAGVASTHAGLHGRNVNSTRSTGSTTATTSAAGSSSSNNMIRRMDDESLRRIVAGQAITDLASAVKELVDNALDAGSTTINIRLFNGGLDIIEVTDDGCGIPIESRPYIAIPNATSKIQSFQDIYCDDDDDDDDCSSAATTTSNDDNDDDDESTSNITEENNDIDHGDGAEVKSDPINNNTRIQQGGGGGGGGRKADGSSKGDCGIDDDEQQADNAASVNGCQQQQQPNDEVGRRKKRKRRTTTATITTATTTDAVSSSSRHGRHPLRTFGFRGEALFCLSNLSENLVVATRTSNEQTAQRMEFHHDGTLNQNTISIIHRKIGTTVAVLHFLSSLPVRRHDFIRRIKIHRAKLIKIIEGYAIMSVGVRINLMDMITSSSNSSSKQKDVNCREKTILATTLNNRSLRENVSTILGSAFLSTLCTISIDVTTAIKSETTKSRQPPRRGQRQRRSATTLPPPPRYQVHGLISKAGGSNGSTTSGGTNRVGQYVSINRRPVDMPKLARYINDLWRRIGVGSGSGSGGGGSISNSNSSGSTTRRSSRPSYVLEFTLPNYAYDVNLSPDKREVTLSNQDDVFDMLLEGIQALWSKQTDGQFVYHCTQQGQQQQQGQQLTTMRQLQLPMSKQQQLKQQQEADVDLEEDDDEVDEDHDTSAITTTPTNCRFNRRYAFSHDFSHAKLQHEYDDGRERTSNNERNKQHQEEEQQNADATITTTSTTADNNISTSNNNITSTTTLMKNGHVGGENSVAARKVSGFGSSSSKDNSGTDNGAEHEQQQVRKQQHPHQVRIDVPNHNGNGENGENDHVEYPPTLGDRKSSSHHSVSSASSYDVVVLGAAGPKPINGHDGMPVAAAAAATVTPSPATHASASANTIGQLKQKQRQMTLMMMPKVPSITGGSSTTATTTTTDTAMPPSLSSLKDFPEVSNHHNINNSAVQLPQDDRGYDCHYDNNDYDDVNTARTTKPALCELRRWRAMQNNFRSPSASGLAEEIRTLRHEEKKQARDRDDDHDEDHDSRSTNKDTNSNKTNDDGRFGLERFGFQSFACEKGNNTGNRKIAGNKNETRASSSTVPIQQHATQPKDMISGDGRNHDDDDDEAHRNYQMSKNDNNVRNRMMSTTPDAEGQSQSQPYDAGQPKDSDWTDHDDDEIQRQHAPKMQSTAVEVDEAVVNDDGSSKPVETTEDDEEEKDLANIVTWQSFTGGTQDVINAVRNERIASRQHRIRKRILSSLSTTTTSITTNDDDDDDDDNDGAGVQGQSSNSRRKTISLTKSDFNGMTIVGQFNMGFILARSRDNHLWILDQHACDEKYNFEKLFRETVIHEQRLIVPMQLDLSPSEETCVLDHMDIFEKNGFRFVYDPDKPPRQRLSLTALPHSGARDGRKAVQFGKEDVSALCAILGGSAGAGEDDDEHDDGIGVGGGTGTDGGGMYGNNAVRRYAAGSMSAATQSSVVGGGTGGGETAHRIIARLPKAIAMFASRACRGSIMIGKALSEKEMDRIVKRLSNVEHPWNCPHGRPTMRHLSDVRDTIRNDDVTMMMHNAGPTVVTTTTTNPHNNVVVTTTAMDNEQQDQQRK